MGFWNGGHILHSIVGIHGSGTWPYSKHIAANHPTACCSRNWNMVRSMESLHSGSTFDNFKAYIYTFTNLKLHTCLISIEGPDTSKCFLPLHRQPLAAFCRSSDRSAHAKHWIILEPCEVQNKDNERCAWRQDTWVLGRIYVEGAIWYKSRWSIW